MTDRERWDQKHSHSPAATQPDFAVTKACDLKQPGLALDLACGTGRNAIYMARSGWTVFPVDFSPIAIQSLVARAATENLLSIHLVVADLTSSPLRLKAESYDLICVARYMQRDLFPAIVRALRTAGLLAGVFLLPDEDPAVAAMRPNYLLLYQDLTFFTRHLEVVALIEKKAGRKHRRTLEFVGRKH